MRVGFLSNQLGLRGTEVAMYDYADLNETMLGNQSVVLSFRDADLGGLGRFAGRFSEVMLLEPGQSVDDAARDLRLDALYVIKGGWLDDRVASCCRCCVHAVFRGDTPHGDAFAVISEAVNHAYGTAHPVLPHVVRPPAPADGDLREALGIPRGALVFGRHGGRETFDLAFAKETVLAVARARPRDRWFLFVNTEPFGPPLENVVFLEGTWHPGVKRAFLETCDAMLHARRDGETFGLACAEFAVLGKRVVTFAGSKDRFHLRALRANAVVYEDAASLAQVLMSPPPLSERVYAYTEYAPEHVMPLFERFIRKGGPGPGGAPMPSIATRADASDAATAAPPAPAL